MESSLYCGKLRDPSTWRLVLESRAPLQSVEAMGRKCFVLAYEEWGFGELLELDMVSGDKKSLMRSDAPVKWMVPLNRGILASVMLDASENPRLYDYRGRPVWEARFDPPGSLLAPHSIGSEAVFIYSSFDAPYILYSMNGGLHRILGDRLRTDMDVRHGWAISSDGTRIHMFIVKRRGVYENKVLIYGYGGFGISLTPRFYPHIFPLLEDGGVFVVTNLRGGSEYGEDWHKAGMRRNKKKVFEDFKACIEEFKKRGARVVAMGSSNGGLLVGAAVTQYPELLDGAVIGYPVLDMLRFHKLYIGAAWIPEYGDPDNPEDREYLASYSPYHNVRSDAEYPPILIYTGLNDDRVHPAHALKFAARLRDVGASALLRVETRSGHSGATPDVKAREYADVMAFVYQALGLEPRGES
jgi:prolyl oligopeptidase